MPDIFAGHGELWAHPMTDGGVPTEGDVLAGKYVVERVLGVGGMGVVVAAKHVELGEKVALKFLLPAGAARGDVVARFLREAQAAARIRSEHVARISDIGRLPSGAPYIVMEHLVGRDLADELEKRGPLPIALAVGWVLQACEAIAEAHALGIVHRDLKPANLFLTKRADGSDLVKVLDFGISKAAADADGAAGPSLTATHGMMGSPLYMSPEQIRSAKKVDSRADVWSIAVLLHELIAGRPPFDADSLPGLLAAILSDPPAPLRRSVPSAPAELEAVLLRSLEKDPAQRTPNVAVLAEALAPFAPEGARLSIERIANVLRVEQFAATMLPSVEEPAAFAPTAAASKAKSSDPVLAVLPFDNLSSDAEMQFFSDGVSEEIIQRLSRGASIKVIGRTSSFHFRGERKAEAATSLNCSHVLDGSIRRAASRVRISAHLVEAASQTTLWSERYDRGLDDVFAVQDEISEHIAAALKRTFTSSSTKDVDATTYDLYLRATFRTYSPDEARTCVGLLETATERAPHFVEAWGRLAYARVFHRLYQPYAERAALGALVARDAQRALDLDPQNLDALTAQYFLVAPFGRFAEAEAVIERMRRAPGLRSDQEMFIGWHSRAIGRVRDSAEETERLYRFDSLSPMFGNAVAIARMAAGRIEEAVPVLEELVVRVPGMSFAVANLLRARAFVGDWAGFDRLLDPKANHELREFKDGLAFLRAKREPTAENVGGIRSALLAQVETTGSVDLSRLVYAAHLGLVDEAHDAAERSRLGPRGADGDVIGIDAYRTGLLFWHGMPELRNDPRFVRLCARLGLVDFWLRADKWPDCADEVPYDFRAECEKARGIPKEEFAF